MLSLVELVTGCASTRHVLENVAAHSVVVFVVPLEWLLSKAAPLFLDSVPLMLTGVVLLVVVSMVPLEWSLS